MSEKFDINKLTLGETGWVEDYSGMPLASLADESKAHTSLLIGLATVINKRSNPKFTVEDATKLTLKEMTDLIGGDEDDSPKSRLKLARARDKAAFVVNLGIAPSEYDGLTILERDEIVRLWNKNNKRS